MNRMFFRNLFVRVGLLEKNHKIITYASLLFLTISTYFLRAENESIKVQFASIEERNKSLKSNMILFNSSYEKLPLPVWQKVKRGNRFIMQYVNPIYIKFFGHDFKNEKFELIGKSNFDLFPKKIAQMYYENDVAVSILGQKFESIEDFEDESGKKLKLKVVKWREIKNKKDTLIYGIVKDVLPVGK